MRALFLIALLGFASALTAQETIDPNDDGSQFAWSENAGWINAEPLADGGPGATVRLTGVSGWLWSENMGWISLSCTNTDSCQDVQYGVGHDGSGALSGFGWSENAGWVSFSCANTESCTTVNYGVAFDPADGFFSGYAWSENLGWISFSCDNTASCGTVPFVTQTGLVLLTELLFQDRFEAP